MDWINNLFTIHSSIQTVVILSIIIACGLGIGKLKVMGISLGIAFVFFVGIFAGHLGFSVDSTVLDYAETFGLAMFVYCLGLHVGPNFFGSLRHEGMALNIWSLVVVIVGTLFALLLIPLTGINLPDMVGLLCGATTNTPALGAATQALSHLGMSSGSVALATAVTYPLGVLGVIVAMIILRKFFVKPTDLEIQSVDSNDHTYIAEFEVINPATSGKDIATVSSMTHLKFIISRIWRGNEVIVPTAETVLKANDDLLVITTKEDEGAMEILFGKKINKDWNKEAIDWNAIDSLVESRILVLTRTELNGKRLGELHLRKSYGVNVSCWQQVTCDCNMEIASRSWDNTKPLTMLKATSAILSRHSMNRISAAFSWECSLGWRSGLFLSAFPAWKVLSDWALLAALLSWESLSVHSAPKCTSSLTPRNQPR